MNFFLYHIDDFGFIIYENHFISFHLFPLFHGRYTFIPV